MNDFGNNMTNASYQHRFQILVCVFVSTNIFIFPNRIIIGVLNNLTASAATLLLVCQRYQFDFCSAEMCNKGVLVFVFVNVF